MCCPVAPLSFLTVIFWYFYTDKEQRRGKIWEDVWLFHSHELHHASRFWDQLLHQGNARQTLTHHFVLGWRCDFLDETLPVWHPSCWLGTVQRFTALFYVTETEWSDFTLWTSLPFAGPCWRRCICPSSRLWTAPLQQRTDRVSRCAGSKDSFGRHRILLKCDFISVKHQVFCDKMNKWFRVLWEKKSSLLFRQN